jgi:hypothetical protein
MRAMRTAARTSAIDAVVDRYAGDVDRTLLRRNLKLTPQERLDQLQELARFADELRRAGRTARRRTAK